MILTSVFMIPVFWFAAPLVSFIKQDFSASVPALRVLSLGLPFFFVSSLVMWTLITLKKQIILMAVYGASMVVNIILNMWFVPEHGYMAAAWITVGSEGLVLLLSGIALMREFKV